MSDFGDPRTTPTTTRQSSISPTRDNPGTNLFVTGLAPKIKEQDLYQLFSKYGQVHFVNK
jgi:RNA recognition motif-containing protein